MKSFTPKDKHANVLGINEFHELVSCKSIFIEMDYFMVNWDLMIENKNYILK